MANQERWQRAVQLAHKVIGLSCEARMKVLCGTFKSGFAIIHMNNQRPQYGSKSVPSEFEFEFLTSKSDFEF
ncbi:hypothetical protein JOB18_045760 [Solea senegalensis]|uniref:Uncharacterized protein n=1 Tax=Solea senegalensis TaxID=28829 RepID=A0AAV6RE50_SOLSE|nr:hypothetical protein JOB18_045760 [Solea senegalensis]